MTKAEYSCVSSAVSFICPRACLCCGVTFSFCWCFFSSWTCTCSLQCFYLYYMRIYFLMYMFQSHYLSPPLLPPLWEVLAKIPWDSHLLTYLSLSHTFSPFPLPLSPFPRPLSLTLSSLSPFPRPLSLFLTLPTPSLTLPMPSLTLSHTSHSLSSLSYPLSLPLNPSLPLSLPLNPLPSPLPPCPPYCTHSYNLSQLEDWVRGHGLTGWEVLTQLQPSVEAAKLLQMKKSTTKDADAICELCTHLNPLQVSSVDQCLVGTCVGHISIKL